MPPLEPLVSERADETLPQQAQRTVRVGVAQPQNRLADDLPWPVKRRIPAPVAPEYLRPESTQILLPRPEVRSVSGGAAHRIDRWVLEEHKGVGDPVHLAQPHQLSLQLPGFCVGHEVRQTPDFYGGMR